VLEIELDERVLQKVKLVRISETINSKIQDLLLSDAMSKLGIPPIERIEKTTREKCLEAIQYRSRTAREVCRQIYPRLAVGSLEEERATKVVSMCLMRLATDKSEKLAWRIKIRGEYVYSILPSGERKLRFLRKKREMAASEKLQRVRMENIAEKNEELICEIENMRYYNSETLTKFENAALAIYFQQLYGGINDILARQIVALQRVMMKDDEELRITALKQSTDCLLELCAREVKLSNSLEQISAR
jgi:hypothetical protein